MNLYGFVRNNPEVKIDRYGLLSADAGVSIGVDIGVLLGVIVIGMDASTSMTYKVSTGWPPTFEKCFTVTFSPKVGIGIGDVGVGLAFTGSIGSDSYVGAGNTVSTGVCAVVAPGPASEFVGLGGGLSIADSGHGHGWGIGGGGTRGSINLGVGLDICVNKSYSAKACRSVCLTDMVVLLDAKDWPLIKKAGQDALDFFKTEFPQFIKSIS